jgi:hypothetical protein
VFRPLVIAFAVLLAGCDMVSNALAPAHERINAVMPVPPQTKAAIERMLSSEQLDRTAKGKLEEQLARMLEARALTCSVAVEVGRFDSDQEIRDKLRNPPCFEDQNALIQDWAGLHLTAQILQEPPLVPHSPLMDKTLVPGLESDPRSVALTMAKDANVLVAMHDKKFTAFSYPDFRPLSEIKPTGVKHIKPWLSGNGRVLIIPLEKGLVVYEVSTGATVWSSKKYSRVVAWLPESRVFLAQRSEDGTLSVLDPQQSTPAVYPVGGKGTVRTAITPKGDLVAAVNHDIALMRQSRHPHTDMLEYQLVRRWRTNASATGELMLMRNGSYLAFESSREVGWLDFESNRHGVWELTNVKGYGMAKISENQLMISATADGKSFGQYVLNIDNEELRQVQDFDTSGGVLQSLGDRPGYAFAQRDAITVGGNPSLGDPQRLIDFAAAANLRVQLARMERLAAEEARAALVKDAIKDVSPLKGVIPGNAELAAVGVYESAHGNPGVVKIKLSPGRRPLVLILTSYEPVQWQIERSGRPLHAVLLSGYNPSSVVGHGNAEVVRIGRDYAYEFASSSFAQLKRNVETVTKKPLTYFQGLYKGEEFNVK